MHTGVTLQTRSFRQTHSRPPVTSESTYTLIPSVINFLQSPPATSCVDAALAAFTRAYMN